MKVLPMVFVSSALLAFDAVASENGGASDIASAIVGPWRLIDWMVTDHAGGRAAYPLGENPDGLLIYTSNGQMSVQLMRGDFSDGKDDTEAVLSEFFAYYGTYTIDEAAKTITHWVEGSRAPSWVGSEQVRGYEIDGDQLRLIAEVPDDDVLASAGAGGSNVVTWERIGDTAE